MDSLSDEFETIPYWGMAGRPEGLVLEKEGESEKKEEGEGEKKEEKPDVTEEDVEVNADGEVIEIVKSKS
jgi:hypothetical protein